MTVLCISASFTGANATTTQATPRPAFGDPAFHTRPVAVPEGTPVVVHILGQDFIGCGTGGGKANPRAYLIQVDQDVVVDGAIVVPHGSLGSAQLDGGERRHREKICYFHMIDVLGIDGVTHLINPERIDITPDIPGVYHDTFNHETYVRNAEFTGKLKADTIDVPVETRPPSN